MYDLAYKMSRDTNELLWWAIVGFTEQSIMLKSEDAKHLMETESVRNHVSRLNNKTAGGKNKHTETNVTDPQAPPI